MADLHIQRAHPLGLAAARKIAYAWAEHVEEKYDMQCTYAESRTGDEVRFVRPGVQGSLQVTKDRFELVAQLGFLVGAFKSTIEREIVKQLDDMLQDAQPKSGRARPGRAD